MKESDVPNQHPARKELDYGCSLWPFHAFGCHHPSSPGPALGLLVAAMPVSAIAGGLEQVAANTVFLLPEGGQGSLAAARDPASQLPLYTAGAGCPLPLMPMWGCLMSSEEELKATVPGTSPLVALLSTLAAGAAKWHGGTVGLWECHVGGSAQKRQPE